MTVFGRCVAVSFLVLLPAAGRAQFVENAADPASVALRGPGAVYTLLVTGRSADGRLVDRTHEAHFRSLDPKVAVVSAAGVVRAVGDGHTTVVAEIDDGKGAAPPPLQVSVSVVDATAPRRFNFDNDVEPVLSRHGCNSAGCHGKAEGQNGFKLSVFGFDPAADYAALVKEARGRRVFPAAPDYSLVLRKMSGRIAHGGGVRVPVGSADYETLREWIAAGAPFGRPTDPKATAVRVEPAERVLAPGGKQQLRVIARYSDGREADVTALAKFLSNNDGLASVDAGGLVTAGDAPGEAAVMAGFMNQVDVFRVVVPRAEQIAHYPSVPENNFIDRLVFAKLRKLNVVPSDLCDDAEYLRRVYLDVIGTLPTADEARRFLDDRRPDRRARLVDELLERPEYADYWALQWSDLLRVDRQALGVKRAYAYYKWIHESVAANWPFDEFARAVVTAEGPLGEDAPANFYKVVPRPGDEAGTLSQVFLGVRIGCAECHHHPFDRWGTADYYGMTAYFSGVSVKPTGRDEAVFVDGVAGGAEPAHRRGVFRPPAGRADAGEGPRAGRPPRRPGRLADAAGQPVLRPQPGQPRLGALPRPRPGRAGGRRARHQPADQPRIAGRPGEVRRREQIRCQSADSHHRGVARLPAVVEAERHQRARRAELFAGAVQADRGRGAAGHGVPDDRRARALRRNAGGDAGDPAVGQQGVALLPEGVRPAGAGERL